MKMTKTILFCILIISLFSCKNDTKSNETQNEQKQEIEKQLNITILLDLSDRIKPEKYPSNPEHSERDIEIVNYFTEYFKQDMEQRGVFKSNGKIKVVFSPRPDDREINSIASKLKIDLEGKNPKEKKNAFTSISEDFKENLTKIYSKTIDTDKYPGSDTWRFFKNDVKDYCVNESGNYRNILVIITDGYIYHVNSKKINKNRSQYLSPELIQKNREHLIGEFNIVKKRIKKYDFGYIAKRKDLEDLEILVLEINPTSKRIDDEDVIKEYLSKWFTEMNVKYFDLYKTDLPEYTKSKIEKFINK
jgi:hypothetical protein